MFIFDGAIIDKLNWIDVNGSRINCENKATCDVSIETRDAVDQDGTLIKRFIGTKSYLFVIDNKQIVDIKMNPGDQDNYPIHLCLSVMAVTGKPHKKKRIKKKWWKQHKSVVRPMTMNLDLLGKCEMKNI